MSALASTLHRAVRWHRPLMVLSGAMLALLLACLVGLAVDDRVLTGVPIWLKPTKFAISAVVYGITLAWQLSLLSRWRRTGWVMGTVVAAMLAGELVVIVVQVVRGQTSHFNFTTALNGALFVSMALMIVSLWVANLVAGVLFLFQRLGDRSVSWAIRTGTLIALAGMAVAFAMPRPRPGQDPAAGVIGAHTVGAADGGPGLPLTGWSTVAGDLRVPHFVGIHGLQALLVAAFALSALAGRYAVLRSDAVRSRAVLVLAGGYAGALALVTWQALRGQSIVQPDAVTVTVASAIAVVTAVGLALTVRAGRGHVGGHVASDAAAA